MHSPDFPFPFILQTGAGEVGGHVVPAGGRGRAHCPIHEQKGRRGLREKKQVMSDGVHLYVINDSRFMCLSFVSRLPNAKELPLSVACGAKQDFELVLELEFGMSHAVGIGIGFSCVLSVPSN